MFELSNYDNCQPNSEISFQDSISDDQHKKRKCVDNDKYEGLAVKEEKLDDIEALIVKRFPKGKGT